MKRKKALISKPGLDETEGKFRYRVRNPNDFVRSSFRTKALSGVLGVKLIVGKLKNGDGSMVAQSYLFDKTKWTRSKAREWIKDHVRKENLNLRLEEITRKNVQVLSDEELYDLRNRAKQLYIPGFMKKASFVCGEIDHRKLPRFNTILDRDILKFRKVEQPPFPKPSLTDYEDEYYIQLIVEGQGDRARFDTGYISWITVSDLKGVWYLYSEKLGCFVGMMFDKYFGWDKYRAKEAMKELLGDKYYSNVGTGISIDKDSQNEVKIVDFEEFFEDMKLEVSFKKVDQEERIVVGVVYEPNVVDSQGDFMKASTICKMAHQWMIKYQKYKDSHKSDIDSDDICVIESFIAPITYAVGTEIVSVGSWVLATKILNENLWKRVKDGELNAYSIGGYGKRKPM